MATAQTVKKVTPRKTAVPPAAKAETKPVRKAATVSIAKAKAASTQTTAPATVVKAAAKATLKLYVLLQAARPTSGPRLVSHTQAAFEVLGLADGLSVKRNALATVIGQRAIGYHVEQDNFVEKADSIALSDVGRRNFKARTEGAKYDAKLTAAFKAMFLRGKEDSDRRILSSNMMQVGLTLR